MRKGLFTRLAVDNIRKNARTYFPYILTCICAVSMYYIIHALSQNPAVARSTLGFVLELGTQVMTIFSVLFLFYTNSFLMKRRKKEFGLFNILGMEKKHICAIIFIETLLVFLISMVTGIGFGLLLSKLVHLLLFNLLQFNIQFSFEVSLGSLGSTLGLFGIIFVLLLLFSLWQIRLARPIELIRGGQVGEREPKAKWVIALLGLLILGGGYYLSVLTQAPVMVLMTFAPAVILVIVGTYLVFTAGGIALLKLLRRNKGYYYKPNHFISVSGMMYRMKQNAAGLATICILSTMVLVMISSTAALYFGMEDSLERRYPRDIIIQATYSASEGAEIAGGVVDDVLARRGLEAQNRVGYHVMPLYGHLDEGVFTPESSSDVSSILAELYLIPGDELSRITGEAYDLGPDEVVIYAAGQSYGSKVLNVLDHSFAVVGEQNATFDAFSFTSAYNSTMLPTYYIGVQSLEVLDSLLAVYEQIYDSIPLRYQMGFDLDAPGDTQLAVEGEIRELLAARDGFVGYTESRAGNRQDFLEMYGGLFFLGIFLGIVFIMATVLIIYYKQISEGYDDQRRYDIMQKVGLSRREVRRAINSQVLTMFFLPLLVAFVHVAFAFPSLLKMLQMLNLHNNMLFVLTTVLSAVLFTVFYVAVYSKTAKVYYKIVEREA